MDYINYLHPAPQGRLRWVSTPVMIFQLTMLLHLSCVEIQDRVARKKQVITETKLFCNSRHGPTRHAASTCVAEMQFIAVERQASVTETEVVFVEMQVEFNLFPNKSKMYINSVIRQH